MSWMWAASSGGGGSCSDNNNGNSSSSIPGAIGGAIGRGLPQQLQGSTRSLDRSSPTRRRRTSADTKKRQRSPEPRLQLNNVMVDPIFDYQFRVILIGDSAVGKSSLLRKFTFGSFAEVSDPTVGVDFFARLVRVDNGHTTIKLQLWDTAGQERFRSITKAYYRNSVGVLLVYDITDMTSFQNVGQWMSEARRHIEPHQATFVMVGCKKDMSSGGSGGHRQVSYEEAQNFAAQNGISHFETSSKRGDGVEAPFLHLAQVIYDKIKTGEYKFEDGWDGIKRSYFGHSRYHFHPSSEEPSALAHNTGNTSNNGRRRRSTVTLAQGEPVHSRVNCC